MLKFVAGTMVVVFGLSGSAIAADLAGSEWGLRDKPERFIKFSQAGRLSGSSGCNSLVGTYRVAGNKLSFGPLAVTRKLCPPKRMRAEKRFLGLLAMTARMKHSHKTLELLDNNGNLLLVLLRRDWD